MVDLDVIRKKEQRRLVRSDAYLGGKLPLTAIGRPADGRWQGAVSPRERGRQRHSDSEVVPAGDRVRYYTRSADPDGVDIDAPFDLPAEIQRIDAVGPSKATIVQ